MFSIYGYSLHIYILIEKCFLTLTVTFLVEFLGRLVSYLQYPSADNKHPIFNGTLIKRLTVVSRRRPTGVSVFGIIIISFIDNHHI